MVEVLEMNDRRPEIKCQVILWDELNNEEQKTCEEVSSRMGGKIFFPVFSMKYENHYCLHPVLPEWLPKITEMIVNYVTATYYVSAVNKLNVLNLDDETHKMMTDNIIINLTLHKSVEDQLLVKKKIESILAMKAFW